MPVSKPSLSEIEDYAQYLESTGKAPDEISEYTAYLMDQHGYNKPGKVEKWVGEVMQTAPAQAGVKAFDYLGGLARTLVAHTPVALGARALGGEELSIEKALDDAKKAYSGEALGTGQMLERAGVPEGPELSDIAPGAFSYTGEGLALQRKGPLDVTARGAAGFAGDVALDPLTYAGGAGLVGKAGTATKLATRPAATLSKGAGKKMYKSAFKAADIKARKFKGMPDVSEVAEKYRWGGSEEDIFNQAQNQLMKLNERADDIIKQVDDAGVELSMKRAFEPGQKKLEEWATGIDNIKKGFAKQLKKSVDEQVALGEQVAREPYVRVKQTEYGVPLKEYVPGQAAQRAPTMSELMGIKSSWQASLPEKTYEALGNTPEGAKLGQVMSTGIKEETERAAGKIGLGSELKQLNKERGTILNTLGVLNNESAKALKKNMFTEVDGALAVLNPAIFAGKQAAKLSKMSSFRTRGGKGLRLMSKALDPYEQAQRRFLINLGREEDE